MVFSIAFAPTLASASVFSFFGTPAQADTAQGASDGTPQNSQKMPLVESNMGPSSVGNKGAGVDVVINDAAITPSMGPLGSAADVVDLPTTDQVSVYTVHAGDTIASVAALFNVSKSTIIAANDITPGSTLTPGTVLTILPLSGALHTVVKGDTLKKIAKKYKVEVSDIAFYNDITSDADLNPGDTLIIPDATIETTPTIIDKSGDVKIPKIPDPRKPDLGNYFLRPIAGGIRTQGAHGWHHAAVDIGAPVGTPILAAADGVVIIAKTGGWNLGYGNYVVINHTVNGKTVQTLYGHMSQVSVVPGQSVSRGEPIGAVGMTGHTTGPHVHFEVRGAINPIAVNRNYGL